jgi:type IV pilus assembly protein PilN
MIRINLLPYRTARRQQQILQHVGALLFVVVATLFCLFLADLYKSSELTVLEDEFSNIKAQNDVLRIKIGKIKDLDKLRKDVERKLELVDQLQQGRFLSLATLGELARVIPENVWVSKIDIKKGVSISGLGESNKAVANFMRALDESPQFTGVKLQTITRVQIDRIPVRKFNLTLALAKKKKVEEKPVSKGGKR